MFHEILLHILIIAAVSAFSSARSLGLGSPERFSAEMEKEPSMLHFMVSDYLRHLNTPAAERFMSEKAKITTTEAPEILASSHSKSHSALRGGGGNDVVMETDSKNPLQKYDGEQRPEGDGWFGDFLEDTMQNDGHFGSFQPEYSSSSDSNKDDASLQKYRTNSVSEKQHYKTSFYPGNGKGFANQASSNIEVPAAYDYRYTNPAKTSSFGQFRDSASSDKLTPPHKLDFEDLFGEFGPAQNSVNDAFYPVDSDDTGFGGFGDIPEGKQGDHDDASFGSFGSFATDNKQNTKPASTGGDTFTNFVGGGSDDGDAGGFFGGFKPNTDTGHAGGAQAQQNGFISDSKDCDTIDTKTCSADDQCSCYGFYHCSAGSCKVRGEAAQSVGPTPPGTFGTGPLPDDQLGLVG